MKIGMFMTAIPGCHKGTVMPPHPVTAVQQSLSTSLETSSNLHSRCAEIASEDRAIGCFYGVRDCSNKRRCKVGVSEPNILFCATERETITNLLTLCILVCIQLASSGRFYQGR